MSDLTAEFQAIVKHALASIPGKHPQSEQNKVKPDDAYDLFTKEAYRIHKHIASLKRFLLSIRRAYLSTDTKPTSRKRPTTKPKYQDALHEDSLFAMFSGDIGFLNDGERDEIDFQAKVIIRRCMDRIKELEEAEKLRKERQDATAGKRLVNMLSSWIGPVVAVEDTLAIHRSGMTWLLNKELEEVSQLQKTQQETRLTRELEKNENQLFRAVDKRHIPSDVAPSSLIQDDEPYDFTTELSQDQLQMLEKENSTMIEELNNTLNQVRRAEKALLEISSLQTQLTTHLAVQTQQTDRLYADSVATSERIEQGNLQLIKTRERNRGTRNFVLAFLIGASFVLLFLDWYS